MPAEMSHDEKVALLKATMKAHGITMKAVAEQVGVSKHQLSSWINDVHNWGTVELALASGGFLTPGIGAPPKQKFWERFKTGDRVVLVRTGMVATVESVEVVYRGAFKTAEIKVKDMLMGKHWEKISPNDLVEADPIAEAAIETLKKERAARRKKNNWKVDDLVMLAPEFQTYGLQPGVVARVSQVTSRTVKAVEVATGMECRSLKGGFRNEDFVEATASAVNLAKEKKKSREEAETARQREHEEEWKKEAEIHEWNLKCTQGMMVVLAPNIEVKEGLQAGVVCSAHALKWTRWTATKSCPSGIHTIVRNRMIECQAEHDFKQCDVHAKVMVEEVSTGWVRGPIRKSDLVKACPDAIAIAESAKTEKELARLKWVIEVDTGKMVVLASHKMEFGIANIEERNGLKAGVVARVTYVNRGGYGIEKSECRNVIEKRNVEVIEILTGDKHCKLELSDLVEPEPEAVAAVERVEKERQVILSKWQEGCQSGGKGNGIMVMLVPTIKEKNKLQAGVVARVTSVTEYVTYSSIEVKEYVTGETRSSFKVHDLVEAHAKTVAAAETTKQEREKAIRQCQKEFRHRLVMLAPEVQALSPLNGLRAGVVARVSRVNHDGIKVKEVTSGEVRFFFKPGDLVDADPQSVAAAEEGKKARQAEHEAEKQEERRLKRARQVEKPKRNKRNRCTEEEVYSSPRPDGRCGCDYPLEGGEYDERYATYTSCKRCGGDLDCC